MSDQKPRRIKRSATDRTAAQRPDDSYVPAAILPVPDPQEGWDFRWIRTHTANQLDNINVSKAFREGWEPVRKEDHPEMQIPTDVNSQFQDSIEVGGLLLCKIPVEKARARVKYTEEMAAKQLEGVDRNYLNDSDPRMPKLTPDRVSRTQFGGS